MIPRARSQWGRYNLPRFIYDHIWIITHHFIRLVVSTPLKNIDSSIGMMTFPMYGNIKVMFQSPPTSHLIYQFLVVSIDWFKGKITGTSHFSWENLWFPVDSMAFATFTTSPSKWPLPRTAQGLHQGTAAVDAGPRSIGHLGVPKKGLRVVQY